MFMSVGFLQRSGTYLTCKDNQSVKIHPSSSIEGKPQWVLFEEFVLTSANYMRTVTATNIDWLVSMASHYFDLENFPECEAKGEIELAYRRLAYRSTQAAKK